MKAKTGLLKTAIISLLGISSMALAENTNVNVNVNNGEGKVVIVTDQNGETQTIEKTFTAGPDTDVDAIVQALMDEHGLEHKGAEMHKEVIRLRNHGDKDFVWVQKSDDVKVDLVDGNATVVIKKDDNGEVQVIKEHFDLSQGGDINQMIDDLMAQHGIDASDAEVHKKVIKLDRKFTQIDKDKPRMGFMASVKDEGWEVLSVVDGSGAATAGIQSGDIIIEVDGQSTAKDGLGLTEFIDINHAAGDVVNVKVIRDGQAHNFDVTAQVVDSPDVLMGFNSQNRWFSKDGQDFSFNVGNLDKMLEGLHVDVEHLDGMIDSFGDHNIRVVTTGDADAYFFSGGKMSQWMGKKHQLSAVTEGLSSYFGTSQGVLVLNVDANNKLGLKDGDIIQAINGTDVASPKDVIKALSKLKPNDNFEIEIMRNKETLYLDS